MKTNTKTKVVNLIIIIFITFLTAICLAPIVHITALSFSSNTAIFASRVSIFPVDFNTDSYQSILSDPAMIHALVYTIGLTILAASISMFLSVTGAYALSRKRLKGRAFFMVVIIITMYFTGGIIPDYILVKDLGLLNSVWALVLPLSVSAYNLIILKSFFQQIPESFEESAYIDGANDMQILLRIILPLSAPVLATITLFYAVGRWNYFQDVLFYISDKELYTLQMKLYQIIYNYEGLNVSAIEGITGNSLPESIRSAVIVFATVPILIAYPWLQRYFIKGVMIGGIKG
jgi:putative aldouronate transport system permease protein